METLPGRGPENTAWSRDLLGISAVLDDGPGARRASSITWFWSTTLQPEDDAFVCPVRAHVEHAAHVPVRRGPAGLGRWRRETRDVWSDHERFVGPPPARLGLAAARGRQPLRSRHGPRGLPRHRAEHRRRRIQVL